MVKNLLETGTPFDFLNSDFTKLIRKYYKGDISNIESPSIQMEESKLPHQTDEASFEDED